MRNFKRTLALVLAVIMIVGTFATVSAADTWYTKAVGYLDANKISSIGDTADEKITRNEFVLWIAKLESGQLSDAAWKEQIVGVEFTDVTDDHNKAAIAYAHTLRYIVGNGDGTFEPDRVLSLAEASAIIVRMMGYESKVSGLADMGHWGMPYMQVVNSYCHAYDAKFLKETNTYNPDYELKKGEAAYLLATIMNNNGNEGANHELITNADGINLGANYTAQAAAKVVANTYYISSIKRGASAGTAGVLPNGFDAASDVVLTYAGTSTTLPKTITVKGVDFLKLLRTALGLGALDTKNEEVEINPFDHVNHGTMVDLILNSDNTIKSLTINSNSLVVDTYLQPYRMLNATNKGILNLVTPRDGTNVYYPQLPASYSADKALSWTDKTVGTNGKLASAVLNFMGNTYKVTNDNKTAIKVFGADWTQLSVAEAVDTLINAATGECFAVFHDLNADGKYDTVYVKESAKFEISNKLNYEPVDKDDVKGTVTYKTTYGYNTPTGSYNALGYTSYKLKADATASSLGLVLSGSAAHLKDLHLIETGSMLAYNLNIGDINIATLTTGYVERAEVKTVAAGISYYAVSIRDITDTLTTYYIPVDAADRVSKTLPVTVPSSGATADWTFDTTEWYGLVDEATDENVNASITGAIKDKTLYELAALWMVGKYVDFAADENNEIFFIQNTAKTDKAGALLGVEKTETGDNTYNATVAIMNEGTVSIVEQEIRASASSITDYNNYELYQDIFTKGALINADKAVDGRVDTVNDLIYVTLVDDAGKLGYILKNDTATLADDFKEIEGKFFIKLEEVGYEEVKDPDGKVVEIKTQRVYDTTDYSKYTAKYDVIYGFNPFYERTTNATEKEYEYDLYFEVIHKYEDIEATIDAVLDVTKTDMVPVYTNQGSVQVNINNVTDATLKAKYKTSEYYIDADGLVYWIYTDSTTSKVYKADAALEGVKVTDATGTEVPAAKKYLYTVDRNKIVDAATAAPVEYKYENATDKTEFACAPYANLTITAKDTKDKDWLPNTYYMVIDGTKYTVSGSTKIAVITPAASLNAGFAVEVVTVDDIKAKGMFVTDWNASIITTNATDTIAAITVIGTTDLSAPTTDGTTTAPVVSADKLVWLDKTASVYVQHLETKNVWAVVTDKSAYELPTGNEIGSIYKEYPTYNAAQKDIEIAIVPGAWYYVTEDGEIVKSTTVTAKTGVITSIKADGTITAKDKDSGKTISNVADAEFFYRDADQIALYKAGDNTNVQAIDINTYNDVVLKAKTTAVKTAQDNYDAAKAKYDAGNLSADRLAYYKDLLDTAKAALATAKAENLDKYFNGQFWGFANSPAYKFVTNAQNTYQNDVEMTFEYLVVDDVVCVFTDTFVLTAKTAK